MKKLTWISIGILACGLYAHGQNPTVVTQLGLIPNPVPNAPNNLGQMVIGTPGTVSTGFYWVSAVYPQGESKMSGPVNPLNAPGSLSASNFVRISWASSGANSYNVVKTASATAPTTGWILICSGSSNNWCDDTGQTATKWTQPLFTPPLAGSITDTSLSSSYGGLGAFILPNFPGPSVTNKLDQAITAAGAGPATILIPSSVGCGDSTNWPPNGIGLLDFRNTQDLIGSSTCDADRPPLMLLTNHVGDFKTVPLAGTVTLTNGSTVVTGVNTHFTDEICNTHGVGCTIGSAGVHLGRSVKLNADNSATAWTLLASVTDDTHATLAANYNGAGGSGAASYFISQMGFAIRNMIDGGIPNTQQGGESVGLTVTCHRFAPSLRGNYCANFNATYDTAWTSTPSPQGQTIGLEIDMTNKAGVDDTAASQTFGLDILSAGANKPFTGLQITSTSAAGNWLRGGLISGWQNEGLVVQTTNNTTARFITFFDGGNANSGAIDLCGMNIAFSSCIWSMTDQGNLTLGGAGGGGTINAVNFLQSGVPTTMVTTAPFTTAANTNFQTIPGLAFTIPANTAINIPFHCAGYYQIGTAVVAVSFGIQSATIAPTAINAVGNQFTAATADTSGQLVNLNTTTATAIVTATPGATATNNPFYLDGLIQNPSNASTNTINIMVKTATAADAVTVGQGTVCTMF